MRTISHSKKVKLNRIMVFLAVFLVGMFTADMQAQTNQQPEQLLRFAERESTVFWEKKNEAIRIADSLGIPVRTVDENGRVTELMRFEYGMPVYYTTHNLEGAQTISTDRVWLGGGANLALDGDGLVIGIWDEGRVLRNHQEFVRDDGTIRVVQIDHGSVSPQQNRHATHVAGTIIARGVDIDARGMANQSELWAHDWNDEIEEMALASQSIGVSNHSYGALAGWQLGTWYSTNPNAQDRWHWFGQPAISNLEDWKFGFYDNETRIWDSLAYAIPDYLIVKSAGNDRNDNHNGWHMIWNGGWNWNNTPRGPNGRNGGYDCISTFGVAKNILTVGAVQNIPGGYNGPASIVTSTFSSWGPTDDGRIKPDIVAKGVNVYSTDTAANNISYTNMSGTSMAAPMVTGSIALLQQHFANTHNNAEMRAATRKALVIHTADSANTDGGPDYRHGWGLMNTEQAAQVITNNAGNPGLHISEHRLNNRETIDIRIWPTFIDPLKVTIAWTDVPGEPPPNSLNPLDTMLVNDLDIRVIELESGIEFEPWILDPANPANPATRGDNFRDNVEQVQIPIDQLPQGQCPKYIVRITHKGDELREIGFQDFSLIITGNRPGIVYAKHDAAGNNNGSSWDDAYTNLQQAINAAQQGDEIWVAAGTYYPTGNGSGRTRHFNLRNCIEIYGGFEGTEDASFPKIQRNLLANETFLDGDNDRYNVMRSYAGIDSTAVIDGFTIQNGRADCDLNGCNWLEHTAGGGIQNEGDPVIRNCKFTNNFAMSGGGAIANIGSKPMIIMCIIDNNIAEECGGGIWNYSSSNPKIINCLIINNKATNGGGICNNASQATIINSTIADNFAYGLGGGIFTEHGDPSILEIKNCIIWKNETDSLPEVVAPCGHYCGNQIFNLETNTINLSYTNLQQAGDPGDVHIINLGTINYGPGMISADPEFVNNYRLQANSPSVDAGNNDHVPTYLKVDLDWRLRIDSVAKIVDHGAYEWQQECLRPKNLTALNLRDTSALLTWTPSGNEVEWQIEWGAKDFAQSTGQKVIVAAFPHQLAGLQPETEYDFYVRAICTPGDTSHWAGSRTFQTREECQPITTLTVVNVTEYTATVEWVEPATLPQNGYEIEVIDMNQNIVFSTIVPVSTNVITVTGLDPGSIYYFDIRSDCGSGHYSSIVFTTFITVLCDPPQNLTWSTTADEVTFYWDAPPASAQIDAYLFELFDQHGVSLQDYTVQAPATSFTIGGLTPNTSYIIQIQTDCGNNNLSATIWDNFQTQHLTCNPPVNVSILPSALDALLIWDAPVPAPTLGYGVVIVHAATGTIIHTTIVPAGTTQYLITGLIPTTDYEVHIQSNCDQNNFSTLVTLSFTTLHTTAMDFGDAPEDPALGFFYPTTLANNGARHIIDPSVYLGDLIDGEPDGQPTIRADGDDINNLNDEDGVFFLSAITPGNLATVRIKASVDGFINAWIDFDKNGNWSGASDQIFNDQPVSAGWNILSFNVPNNASIGRTYARFRFNTTGGLYYDGQASDGEVEDYMVYIFPSGFSFRITPLIHTVMVPALPGIIFPLNEDITLEPGDFIGAFYQNEDGETECGGAIMIEEEGVAIFGDVGMEQALILYGNDPDTPDKDGFYTAETFEFRALQVGSNYPVALNVVFDPDYPHSDGTFQPNGLSRIASIQQGAELMTQTINIPSGWSGISSYIEPENPHIEFIMSPVAGELSLIYNAFGGIYWPAEQLNILEQWNTHHGYVIKIDGDASLPVTGNMIANKQLAVDAGWNLIPILTDELGSIDQLLGSVGGHVITKEVAGPGVYYPQFGINTIGNYAPGKALWTLMNSSAVIDFGFIPTEAKQSGVTTLSEISSPWDDLHATPESHIVIFNVTGLDLEPGDVIAGFTFDDRLTGICLVENPDAPFALTLFGNDAFSRDVTGFEAGEQIRLKAYRAATGEIFDLEVTYNPVMNTGQFEAHGLSEVTGMKLSATGLSSRPNDAISIFPNPTAGVFSIAGVEVEARVSIFNPFGNEVKQLTSMLPAEIDLSGHSKGVYFVRIDTGERIHYEKVVIN